jgi:hypothetical protein
MKINFLCVGSGEPWHPDFADIEKISKSEIDNLLLVASSLIFLEILRLLIFYVKQSAK